MRKGIFALTSGVLGPLFLTSACHGTARHPSAQPPQPTAPRPVPHARQPEPQQAHFSPIQPAEPAVDATNSNLAAMAFPCAKDADCLTHRCNGALGKCAWPCRSDADCQPNTQCLAPACIPILGQRTAPQ